MALPLIAAGIGAGSQLVGNIMQQQAEKKKQLRQIAYEGEQKGLETQAEAAQTTAAGQAAAFKNMMDAYRAALVK